MNAMLLLGTLTSLYACKDFDCRLIERFKDEKCHIRFDGQTAIVFGTTYPVKQVGFGRTDIWEGWNGSMYFNLFMRPSNRPLRAYVSIYSDRRTYKKWVCEFGRPNEKEW